MMNSEIKRRQKSILGTSQCDGVGMQWYIACDGQKQQLLWLWVGMRDEGKLRRSGTLTSRKYRSNIDCRA